MAWKYSMNQLNSKSRLQQIGKWIFGVFIFQLILVNISAAFHAHRITHYYDDDKVRNLRSSSGTIFLRTWRLMVGRKFPKSLIRQYPQTPYDTVQFKTKNGIIIDTWYLPTDSAKGTIILFHGLTSNKGNNLAEAYEFISMGYNTMLVDLRAHGNSGGKNNSIGVDEAEEVKLAYDYLRAKGEKNIVLWGMSLGAAVITRAVYDYNIQPQKIILEMPFDRLQDHIKARARVLGFPDEPFGFLVTLWTGIEQGYWGFGHQTSKYAAKIKCPALLQWGARDPLVTESEIKRIFKNITAKDKKLVIYEAAFHGPLIGHDPGKWVGEIEGFLSR